MARTTDAPLTRWLCQLCGFTYDETAGLPEDGITPGTRWADVPDSWACPDCGALKAEFEMVQIGAAT
jgi:rubredoxin